MRMSGWYGLPENAQDHPKRDAVSTRHRGAGWEGVAAAGVGWELLRVVG